MIASPYLFTINFETAEGRLLASKLASRYGSNLASTTDILTRVFGLRSPLAPGLSFIGAEARHRRAGKPAAGPLFSSTGTAETLEGALASCLGEAVERLSQFEREGDVALAAAIDNVSDHLAPGVQELIALMVTGSSSVRACDWVRGRDLASGREVLVPADWVLRRASDGPLRMPNTALSTGVAAGPTREDAATRAILELIERDAAALWWLGGRRGRPFALETALHREAAALIERVRLGHRGRTSWIMDITTDNRIPCVVAVSVSQAGTRMARGMAARLGLVDAIRAAIFEMCQSELALLVTELKRLQRGDDALTSVDCQHLLRASSIDAGKCQLLHPVGVPLEHAGQCAQSDASDYERLRQALVTARIDVSLVDLTRAELGIPVVAAIAPLLQRLPSDLFTPRLIRVAEETGGGQLWTGAIPLL
jgi:ribosomal protein S12 methylthiotransferase accessory factor